MSSSETTIHIAIELSTSLWLVATRLPGAGKSKMHRIKAGDTAALLALIGDLRTLNSNRPVKASILRAALKPGETASGCIGC